MIAVATREIRIVRVTVVRSIRVQMIRLARIATMRRAIAPLAMVGRAGQRLLSTSGVIAVVEDAIPDAPARVAPSPVAKLRLVNGASRMMESEPIANGAATPAFSKRTMDVIAVAAPSIRTAIPTNLVKNRTASGILATRATTTTAML